ncbi:flavin monoamine oxidase family protein [Aliiruegeria sabulilitoris]|uniref:flavin monoamine oxidase family protein n=1 Tax=Aliiruegeria sabulilitoris TaxID=1510458 RepID=UPI0009E7A295|nr:FAD-dependent oxidoreductase [Aliiruegeria sabulilitoris]NDR58650.1 FAD-dependent oxidoreductase [Pseudoruegeria sp. M32A2M]
MQETEIVVVGAGIAGLTATLCLQRAGKRVALLEGADRSGGRVRSINGGLDGTARFDTGPAWVWPRWQPHVQRWLEDLSIRPFAQFEGGEAVLDGFGPQVIRQHLPGQDGISRLSGGPSAIVEGLEDRIRPETIKFNAQVLAIDTVDDGLCVQMRGGDQIHCAKVVLATPLRIIAEQIRINAIEPELRNLMQRTPTWMAQQAKAVILYQAPFWRERGLSGRVASRTGPLVEIHDHSPEDAKSGALFGFVGWPHEDRRRDPGALRTAIGEQLVRCFGSEAAHPQDVILQDWATESLICSKIDLDEPPEHPDIGPELLRRGYLSDRLWFVASETASISPGLIEGALVAGETTAMRLLESCQTDNCLPAPSSVG